MERVTISRCEVVTVSAVGAAREILTVLALSALLVSTAQSGEIKSHEWPSVIVGPREIPDCEIPVLIDVIPVIECRVIGSPVKLHQADVGRFEGCASVLLRCNCCEIFG